MLEYVQVVQPYRGTRWVESCSSLTVPMQSSFINTHQMKLLLDGCFSWRRTDSLRCHFWHEPIISLYYCAFNFQCCWVPPIRPSDGEINFSGVTMKDVSIVKMQPEDREGGGVEAHWRSCERHIFPGRCCFVLFFLVTVTKCRQRERTFLCKCIYNHLRDD